MYAYRERIAVFVDHDAEEKYLKLEELGSVLRQLNETLPGKCNVLVHRPWSTVLSTIATVQTKRSFQDRFLKTGHPNLLVVAPGR